MLEYTYVGAAVKTGIVDRTASLLEGRVSVGIRRFPHVTRSYTDFGRE